MRVRTWLNGRADAFILEAKEAEKVADCVAHIPDSYQDALNRAAAYRMVADELRSCMNEFPDHLEPRSE